jgi:putative ABC transport system permease protein
MDRLLNTLSQSLTAVWAFKLRTFFCVVSVAIGISAITIIVAATEGAYKKAFDIVDTFGPDSIMIASGSDESRATGQREKTLTLEDVTRIQVQFSTAYLVTPMTAAGMQTLSYGNNRYSSIVFGSSADYSRTWTWPVVEGSDFTEEDIRRFANVALIGHEAMNQLFGEEDPVGKYITVRNLPVQVVGVLLERGSTLGGSHIDDRIVMPITTVMKKLQGEEKYVNGIRVRFEDQENLDNRVEELQLFLREIHGIPAGQPDDFRIFSPKDIIKFLVAITGSLVAFIGIVGIISLVVAGFVLANLFLLSVRERSREIGIRRSFGARRRDILVQFLAEAVIVTTLGGLIGYAIGIVSAELLQYVAQFPIHFSWRAFAVGLVLSWMVGVGFGLQPASRAANLKPIEAIRG